jgi:hypothetical protein
LFPKPEIQNNEISLVSCVIQFKAFGVLNILYHLEVYLKFFVEIVLKVGHMVSNR